MTVKELYKILETRELTKVEKAPYWCEECKDYCYDKSTGEPVK